MYGIPLKESVLPMKRQKSVDQLSELSGKHIADLCLCLRIYAKKIIIEPRSEKACLCGGIPPNSATNQDVQTLYGKSQDFRTVFVALISCAVAAPVFVWFAKTVFFLMRWVNNQ